MKNLFSLIIILLIGLGNIYATHNRAGEITYKYIGDAKHPYKYRIRVTTYTKYENTNSVDKCELVVHFGDGDSATAPRINGLRINCPTANDGEIIATATKLNIYEADHNFAGPGNYIISMEDPNRNKEVCNIPDADNVSFFLRTELVINDFLGPNNSPILLNPPIDDGCVGSCFEHNPGAYDVEGDSLSYSLTACYANGQPILGYSFPPNMNSKSIDPLKGDLVWCYPDAICQYNVAILIKEYRLLVGTHKRYYVGSILRDMQINIGSCANTPPKIKNMNDTCIVAGTNLNFTVRAVDVDADFQKNLIILTRNRRSVCF
jgi:hypothetical protein